MTRPSSSSPIAGTKPFSSLSHDRNSAPRISRVDQFRIEGRAQIARELRRQRDHLHAERLISWRLLGADTVRKNLTHRFGLDDVTAFVEPSARFAQIRQQSAGKNQTDAFGDPMIVG